MIFWVGITDDDWFINLSRIKPEEVNLWQPASSPPRHMDPGTLFLFKLRAPNNVIVGGGSFAHFSVLPCYAAWEAFGGNNGVTSLPLLIQQLSQERGSPQNRDSDIGCNILLEPFFFAEDDWLPIPDNWNPAAHGLTYDTEDSFGAELWQAVQDNIAHLATQGSVLRDHADPDPKTWLQTTTLAPGTFRVLVTDAYQRRCAVTNDRTLPALVTTHIKPPEKNGPNRINNGLLLRADIHRLFSKGYVSIDPDLRFLVSERIRERYENGSEYYRYHGARIQNLPANPADQPAADFLHWHNEHCFERI